MKQGREPGGHFKQALLEELKAVVSEHRAEQAPAEEAAVRKPAWRHGGRLALGAAVAVAGALAAVLILSGGGGTTTSAFAVEAQQGGGVTIRVYSLKDAPDLEEALQEAGIRAQVTWLAPGTTCREPHFTPSQVRSSASSISGGGTMAGPGALTIAVSSAERQRELMRELRRGRISRPELGESMGNINLDPAKFRPDQSVVISGSPRPYNGDPEGGYEAHFAIAEGPVQPCEPTEGLVRPNKVPPIAEGSGALVGAPPGPGQFLYTKTEVVQLEAWDPDGPPSGPKAKPRYFTDRQLSSKGNAMPALVPTVKEAWTAPDGKMRVRETLGRVEFLSGEDQRRWEEAGSPPPFAYDPAEHDVGHDRSGRPVKEFTSTYWRGSHVFANVGDLAKAPVEPEALRLGIEHRRGGGTVTIERLMEILGEPITSSALRAAAINALAEIPGIEVRRHVTDVTGRPGDALTWESEQGSGFGRELIFDSHTAKILATAEMIFGPRSAREYGVPANTVFRETAYLQSGVVNSSSETAAGSQ